jgi:hypothetical protein
MAATKTRPAPLEPPPKSKPKAPARRVNINERLASARAARAEAQGEAPVLEVGDAEYALPVEMPYDVVRLVATGEFMEGFAALGGEQFASAVGDLGLSMDDLKVFVETIMEDVYGVSEGK